MESRISLRVGNWHTVDRIQQSGVFPPYEPFAREKLLRKRSQEDFRVLRIQALNLTGQAEYPYKWDVARLCRDHYG